MSEKGHAMKSAGMTKLAMLGLTLALATAPANGAPKVQDAETLLREGRSRIEAKDYTQAIVTLSRAREAEPLNTKLYNALADAYLAQGVESMGIIQLAKSLSIDSTQVDIALKLADIHLRAKRWAEAGQLYRSVLRNDPANDPATLGLAGLFTLAKQPAGAAAALEPYVRRHPDDQDAAAKYLDALAASGQDQALAAGADAILVGLPNWPTALRASAKAQLRLGQFQQAADAYRRLDGIEPLDADACLDVARCLLKADDQAGALVWFERAIQGSPTSSPDWSEFAAIYMRQKNWDRAAELYLRKTKDDPGSATAWLNYGLCQQQLKGFTESGRGFGEAIKLKPEWASARYYQAVNYVMSDSTQAACRAYRQFIRLASPQAEEHGDQLRQAYRYLCVTYLVDRNWAAALGMLDPALRLDPNDVQLRLYRGQALLGLNRKPEAKKEFETVLQMEPGNKDARKGLTVLAQYN